MDEEFPNGISEETVRSPRTAVLRANALLMTWLLAQARFPEAQPTAEDDPHPSPDTDTPSPQA